MGCRINEPPIGPKPNIRPPAQGPRPISAGEDVWYPKQILKGNCASCGAPINNNVCAYCRRKHV